MKSVSATNNVNIDVSVGFRTCNNILDKWGCSTLQKIAILGMTEASFAIYQHDIGSCSFTNEHQERLSHILNIHLVLSSMFSNPKNIYGFMKMENNNPYFKGKTPFSLIETGDLAALSEVSLRVDNMRNH